LDAAAEVGPEIDSAPDTTPEVAPETVADTGVASVCALGCMPISSQGAPTGVLFRQYDTLPRPSLGGGDAPSGDWVLSSVDVYALGTFATGIQVTFADHGATAGRLGFGGDALAMELDLDLAVTVSAFGSTGSDSARSLFTLGGCHEVEGAHIVGPLGTCVAGAPPNDASVSLDFELDGGLAIGVELPREALIALLPPDQQEAGSLAIVGPLYLVAGFERP
jgi:hypothetical protein